MLIETLDSFKRRIFALEDCFFEKRFGLDLSGLVMHEDLVADNKFSVAHATAYHAVWCRNLRELFSEATKAQGAFDNFIDIGSGKGKACFYAARKFAFKEIIGIEFSMPLVEIANANKKRFGAANILFTNTDAAQFILPDADNLIFMFNPFDEIVLEKFIANNIEHFRKRNSFIAYANDVQRMSLTRFGFETVFRNQSRKISLFQYANPAAPEY